MFTGVPGLYLHLWPFHYVIPRCHVLRTSPQSLACLIMRVDFSLLVFTFPCALLDEYKEEGPAKGALIQQP